MADEDTYYENIPIIALTANAISGVREMFLQNGFDDYLFKPIDTVKLNAVLERWIPKSLRKSSTMSNAEKRRLKAALARLKAGLEAGDSDMVDEAAGNLRGFVKDAEFGAAVEDVLRAGTVEAVGELIKRV
jgi:CheY-like chemotaxis protein